MGRHLQRRGAFAIAVSHRKDSSAYEHPPGAGVAEMPIFPSRFTQNQPEKPATA
jgi:hypothetical protein